MASTNAADIANDLIASISASDETLDVASGPILDLMVKPQAGRLAEVAQDAADLRLLFTLDFSQVATSEEIRLALANFGSSPGVGTPSTTLQYFMKFTAPTVDITFPEGTLVGSADGLYTFRTLVEAKMLSDNSASYYNADKRTYELAVPVESVGIGAAYNIPKFRIISLLTPIDGIDSTENRDAATGGLDVETATSQAERLKNALKGINLGSVGGIKNKILQGLPELITDVSVVQPYESEFKRFVVGPALDIYSIGSKPSTSVEVFTATAGQQRFYLSNVPVLSITSVLVNNVAGLVDYSLVRDSSVEIGYSLDAGDYCYVDYTLLAAGDKITIEYTYNAALTSIKESIFGSGEGFLFDTDILLRSPFFVNPAIAGDIKALAGYSATEVETNVNSFLNSYFTFTTFQTVLYPEIFRQQLLVNVTGVASFRLTEFRRSLGSLADIEPIYFSKNEVSVFDSNYIAIRYAT
jgi:hypothetical protein